MIKKIEKLQSEIRVLEKMIIGKWKQLARLKIKEIQKEAAENSISFGCDCGCGGDTLSEEFDYWSGILNGKTPLKLTETH